MGFSRKEYWNGMPFPSPADLPDPGIEPWSPELHADSLLTEPPGKPKTPKKSLELCFVFFPHCYLAHKTQLHYHCGWCHVLIFVTPFMLGLSLFALTLSLPDIVTVTPRFLFVRVCLVSLCPIWFYQFVSHILHSARLSPTRYAEWRAFVSVISSECKTWTWWFMCYLLLASLWQFVSNILCIS